MANSLAHPKRRSRPRPASLAPKEHGAYGQLLLPLLVALADRDLAVAAWLLALTALALFVIHEPVMILLGHRGANFAQENRRRASSAAGTSGAVAAMAGGLGLWLAPADARWAALLPAGLGALSAVAMVAKKERTLYGELGVAATLPALAVPVAMANGMTLGSALQDWCTWWLAVSAATFAVRGVIGSAKRGTSRLERLALPAGVVAITAGLAGAGVLELAHAAAAAPMLVGAMVLAWAPPHPRRLRRVGWILVGASVATAGALIATG